MVVSIDDFWKLAVASELLSADDCANLRGEFAGLKGAAQQANAKSVAQWLVATNRLTRYQASVLLAGKPGPFVLGPFVVTERIESGRLARLFRARYQGSQNVILVFLSQLTDDRDEQKRLIELAQAASAVKNPHVTRTFRAVRYRSQTFIVVEDLAGESLLEMLARGPVHWQRACQLCFQAALGLVALHHEHLTHGAICPQHLWIDAGGAARLLQFPLVPSGARLKRREPPLVDYLAPELAEGSESATALTDIYGLGCVLFELVAGRVPFPGGTIQQKLARQRAEFPQRLDVLNPQVPEELADLAAEMLAKDPLLRSQDASRVAHLLAGFGAGTTPRGAQPPRQGGAGIAPGYGAWTAPEWQPPPQARRSPDASAATAEVSMHGEIEAVAGIVVSSAAEPAATSPAIAMAVAARGPAEPQPPGADVPVVVSEPGGAAPRVPRRRRTNNLLVGIAAGLAALAALVVAAVLMSGSDTPGERSMQASRPPVEPVAGTAPPERPPVDAPPEVDAPTSAQAGSEDDGQMLWVSPTIGAPLDPSYLPNGAQVILALRPAELLAAPEGARTLDALGPAGKWAIEHLRTVLGVDPGDAEQLIVAFAADGQLQPQAAYVARLTREIPSDTLAAAWGKPPRARHQGHEYYQGRELAYYLPESGAGRLLAVAPAPLLKPMLESGGQPLLARGLERLLSQTDASRHVNLLFIPSYLLTDGQNLLAGHLAGLRQPIREFLDESIEAVLTSAHVGDDLYLEFRALAPVDTPPLELLELLRNRWEQVPDRVETHVAALAPQPYGRLVVHRFPRMLQLARDYTRGGVEQGQVVLNAYLPQAAAHNLVLGTELTLLESAGPKPAATSTPQAAPPAPETSVAAALARKISLSFPRDSLDRVMEVLAQELGVEIVILGPDLQLEGITKNQSLNNVDERDQPAANVLRKLLALANPEGKLVYVVKPSASGRQTIYITTRAAAQKRGDALPAGL